MDGWNQSGQVRKTVDGELQDPGRRARSGGSRYAGPREVVFGQLDRPADSESNSVQHDQRQRPPIHGKFEAQRGSSQC